MVLNTQDIFHPPLGRAPKPLRVLQSSTYVWRIRAEFFGPLVGFSADPGGTFPRWDNTQFSNHPDLCLHFFIFLAFFITMNMIKFASKVSLGCVFEHSRHLILPSVIREVVEGTPTPLASFTGRRPLVLPLYSTDLVVRVLWD